MRHAVFDQSDPDITIVGTHPGIPLGVHLSGFPNIQMKRINEWQNNSFLQNKNMKEYPISQYKNQQNIVVLIPGFRFKNLPLYLFGQI